jgi:type II secretory pathway component PulF
MPVYIYKAKDGPGKTVEREMAAESEGAVVARLEALGLIPIWVRPKGVGHSSAKVPSQRGISRVDISVFTRQLASMIRSGVPILRALNTIASQTENRRMQLVVSDLEAVIRDGSMLSEGMRRYTKLFPELYVNMVEAGEAGGVLDTMLFRLADAREVEEENRRKVQSAMAYPVLVAVVGFVTIFVLLSFFMPRVMALFEGRGDLPLPTKILLGLSGFFSTYWYWLIFGIVFVVAIFQRLAMLDKGRTFVDGLKLRLPVVGNFMRDVDLARFSRTFALLIDSGVSIERVLRLSAKSIRNAVLREELDAVRDRTMRQGVALSESIRDAEHFPPFVGNMLAVGEETGKIDDSLNEVARFYESSIDRQSRMVTALVEPVLLLVVGSIVGFIVFAMLLPIFQLGTGMR